MTYPLADLGLSRRLERCEARTNASIVESRARLSPETGAVWVERAGAYAMFDGAGSPLTQTFGLGLFATPTSEDLDFIEEFYASRGAAVFHEVSPLVDFETFNLLTARGYRVVELTSLLYQPLSSLPAPDGRVPTRLAAAEEVERWASVAAEGWSEFAEIAPLMYELARMSGSATLPFFAELDGRPVATGALAIHDGVALLAGASTIPSARRRGAQRALLDARLRYAAAHGCDLAMMGASPGSSSQKNAEREGFRVAYTRIKWGR